MIPIEHVIVTGACGYIGSALITTLRRIRPEITVLGIDRIETACLPIHSMPNTRYLSCDLSDHAQVRDALESEGISKRSSTVVFHCAGLFVKDFTHRVLFNREDYFRNNILATQTLISYFQKQGDLGKFVFLSTAYLFKKGVGGSEQVRESIDTYAESKAECEEMISHSTVPWVILRPVRVIGVPGTSAINLGILKRRISSSQFRKTLMSILRSGCLPVDIISILLRSAFQEGKYSPELRVNGSNNVRAYLHIDDMVSATLHCGLLSAIQQKIVSVSTSAPVSIGYIAERITQALSFAGLHVKLILNQSENPSSVFDNSEYSWGWRPKVDPSMNVINMSIESYIRTVLEK